MNEELSITRDQRDLLSGFFLHCWNVFHNGEKAFWDFYADQMDKAKISWRIQNLVAYAAENRDNGFLYFSTVLKNLNIKVEK